MKRKETKDKKGREGLLFNPNGVAGISFLFGFSYKHFLIKQEVFFGGVNCFNSVPAIVKACFE